MNLCRKVSGRFVLKHGKKWTVRKHMTESVQSYKIPERRIFEKAEDAGEVCPKKCARV